MSLITAVHLSRRFGESVDVYLPACPSEKGIACSRLRRTSLSQDDVSRPEQARDATSSLWMQAVARTTHARSNLFIWETNALTQREITLRSRTRSLRIARRTEDYWRQHESRRNRRVGGTGQRGVERCKGCMLCSLERCLSTQKASIMTPALVPI